MKHSLTQDIEKFSENIFTPEVLPWVASGTIFAMLLGGALVYVFLREKRNYTYERTKDENGERVTIKSERLDK